MRSLKFKYVPPNALTLFRLFALGGVWFFLLSEQATLFWKFLNHYQSAAAVGFLGVLTDAFDGPLARKLRAVTEFGRCSDPIVDKLYIPPLLYILFKHLWWPTLLIFLLFELWVVYLSICETFFRKTGREWPNRPGKICFGFFAGTGISTLYWAKTSLWPYFQWAAYASLAVAIGLRIACLYLYHIKRR